jgi:hypothetical protein
MLQSFIQTMNLNKNCLIGLVAVGLAARANAELKWEQKEVDLHPSFSDATAVAHFKYENAGSKPVHIASVQTSCGCTVASLKSNDVAPGDKGEIIATLTIGGRTGTQQKAVTVTTDDPAQPQTILMLKAVIPTLLEVQPIFVFWKQDEALQPKVIMVKASKDSPVTKVTVTSSDPEITTKLEPGEGPKQWKINVVPKDHAKPHAATLTITPDYPQKPPKLFYATARVTGPPVVTPAASTAVVPASPAGSPAPPAMETARPTVTPAAPVTPRP